MQFSHVIILDARMRQSAKMVGVPSSYPDSLLMPGTLSFEITFKVLPVRTKRLLPDGVILGFQSYTVTFIDNDLINH